MADNMQRAENRTYALFMPYVATNIGIWYITTGMYWKETTDLTEVPSTSSSGTEWRSFNTRTGGCQMNMWAAVLVLTHAGKEADGK